MRIIICSNITTNSFTMDIQKLSVAFVYLLWLNPGQGSEMPKCAFEDTIDLSNARFMPDEGYYYTNGILVPLEQVTTYNYIETTKGHRVFHEAHPRGCILKDRNFISFCCNPSGEIFSAIQQGCYKIEDVPNGLDVNVTLKDGSKEKWNPLKKFNLKQEFTSCGNSMQLTIENGEWNIFETGFVYLHQDNRVLGPNDYCLTPVELDYESWILKPVTCSQNSDYLNDNNNGYPLSGLISIPFLIMTILFYIIRPELRNLQGKCIICCLASKAVSTTILFAVEISFLKFPKIVCHSLGK